MDRKSALTIALASMRAVIGTSPARGRSNDARLADLTAAVTMIETMRDEKLPMHYIRVKGPNGIARILITGPLDDAIGTRDALAAVGLKAEIEMPPIGTALPHDPLTCGQCAEAEWFVGHYGPVTGRH